MEQPNGCSMLLKKGFSRGEGPAKTPLEGEPPQAASQLLNLSVNQDWNTNLGYVVHHLDKQQAVIHGRHRLHHHCAQAVGAKCYTPDQQNRRSE